MAETKAPNVTPVNTDEEWEVAHEESGTPIRFENVGDQFIGTFREIRHIVPPNAKDEKDEFDQLVFLDPSGEIKTINAGFMLMEAFSSIAPGTKVRITRTPDVPMDEPGKNDMKDYRVEISKK